MEYRLNSRFISKLGTLTLFLVVITPIHLAVIFLPVMYFKTFFGEIPFGSPLMFGLIVLGFVLFPIIEIRPSDLVLKFFNKQTSSDGTSDD